MYGKMACRRVRVMNHKKRCKTLIMNLRLKRILIRVTNFHSELDVFDREKTDSCLTHDKMILFLNTMSEIQNKFTTFKDHYELRQAYPIVKGKSLITYASTSSFGRSILKLYSLLEFRNKIHPDSKCYQRWIYKNDKLNSEFELF